MYKKHSKCSLAIFLSFFLFWVTVVSAAEEKIGSYTVQNIVASLQDDSILLVLQGDSIPAYTQYELFSPTRLVLDIADAVLAESIDVASVMPENDFAALHVTMLRDKLPQITRFEITLAESHTYKVDRVENNLTIRLIPKNEEKSVVKQEQAILHDIVVRSKKMYTEILFQASQPIEEFKEGTVTGRENIPDSMYIDINNVDGDELVREKEIGLSVDKIRVATRGSGVRIIFDSAAKKLFSYDVKTVPQGLMVVINEPSLPQTSEKEKVNTDKAVVSDPTLDALINSSEAAITNKRISSPDEDVTAAEAMEDSFGFSGYKSTRISVDFYKIDLHNVFRLFRQISDINLIVDESVSGSLTLALNDVPWDFALDIILNLKNLKKEERYNTIVIYPAKKEFVWPERTADNLSFEADLEVIEQESLIIRQSVNQPAEIMQAKELLQIARVEEKNNELEDAAELYEKAFLLWPKNAKIPNRLAALYLVDLGMNAKCVHFAKETLKLDNKNYQAALYAAIASANMDEISAAMEFFSQSISGTPPMKEALVSYAAFSEEKGQPEAALKLLDKYAEAYSDTVNTMTSRARIYDTLGKTQLATEQYKKLLYSGYQLVPGLKKYIRGRLTMNERQLVQ